MNEVSKGDAKYKIEPAGNCWRVHEKTWGGDWEWHSLCLTKWGARRMVKKALRQDKTKEVRYERAKRIEESRKDQVEYFA